MKQLVLAASLLSCETARAVVGSPARVPPLRLAIYYGYPSLVEDARGDVARAAAIFAEYDVIVFGDGLEGTPASAPDAGLRIERERIAPIVAAVHAAPRKARIYGYVDLGSSQNLPLDEIARRIDAWKRIGADGIFFDEAGSDFAVGPARRHAAVRAVHARGLSAFMNAFVTDDLFQEDGSAADDVPGQLRQGDAVLIESFAVRNGERRSVSEVAARAAAAIRWRERFGIGIFAVTTPGTRGFESELFSYAWWNAAAWGLDGIGWGEPDFGASSRLPWRARPAEEAALAHAHLTSPPVVSAAGVRRTTTLGTIVVDAAARRGRFDKY